VNIAMCFQGRLPAQCGHGRFAEGMMHCMIDRG
jgi:hypothetical protein